MKIGAVSLAAILLLNILLCHRHVAADECPLPADECLDIYVPSGWLNDYLEDNPDVTDICFCENSGGIYYDFHDPPVSVWRPIRFYGIDFALSNRHEAELSLALVVVYKSAEFHSCSFRGVSVRTVHALV